MCEPSKREAVVVPDQNKVGVLMQTYYKGYSNFWTERQLIQKDQDKTMCISQRYAASGIMNDNVVTTAIMEYEEYEDSDG